MTVTSSNSQRLFDAVGGHKDAIYYGESTHDGRTTVCKPTTAWEVIFYVGMTFPDAIRSSVDAQRTDIHQFVQALSKLKAFAPEFYGVQLPEDWAPRTRELSEAIVTAVGSLETLRSQGGVLLKVQSPVLGAALWVALFTELYDGTLALQGFSDDYDVPLWGIVLVDLTHGMSEATVMDVKVGFYRLSPFTPSAKVERMRAKEDKSIVRSTGLRICGIRHHVHDSAQGGLVRAVYDKAFGLSLRSAEDLTAVLKDFAATTRALEVLPHGGEATTTTHTDNDCAAAARLSSIQQTLRSLVSFFESTPEGQYLLRDMALVSTSLLILYDAATQPSVSTGNDESSPPAAVVHLIDFARSGHRRLNFGEDKIGFLDGLRHMEKYCDAAAMAYHEGNKTNC